MATGQVKLTSSQMRHVATEIRGGADDALKADNTIKKGAGDLGQAGIKSTFGNTFVQKVEGELVPADIKTKNRCEELARILDQLAKEQDEANRSGAANLAKVN
ncbi:hypothetical protein [Gordonia sihwensis]|uniref:hypothetical protein n=1 Tax=Gordonia sihwensis TaxID=173559 RepID=UPI003D972FD6